MKNKRRWALIGAMLGIIFEIYSYNTYQISSREGLSNSAVLSLYQDKNGFIWAGTCDGLNVFDGQEIETFYAEEHSSNSISGNLIENVSELSDGKFWIHTDYGLDLYDKYTETIKHYKTFAGSYLYSHNQKQEVVVLYNGVIYRYDCQESQFQPIYALMFNPKGVVNFFVDENNVIWLCTPDNVMTAKLDDGHISHVDIDKYLEGFYFTHFSHEKEYLYFVDGSHTLWEYNIYTHAKKRVTDLGEQVQRRGYISTIIRDGHDYWVGFLTDGLVQIVWQASTKSYTIKETNIKTGIFSLLKDHKQNILWIGSDGQGILRYSKDEYTFYSYTYDQFPIEVSTPTRCLFVDGNRDLWIGTKGDGLIRIDQFQRDNSLESEPMQRYTTHNSQLSDNSIYTLSPSRKRLFWIGGDGNTLNYYSYRDRTIHRLALPTHVQIQNIHALCETAGSLLWVATNGYGIYKITLDSNLDYPTALSIEPVPLEGDLAGAHIYSMYPQDSTTLWIGTRGHGIIKLDMATLRCEKHLLHEDEESPVNDIFSIYPLDSSIYLGTSNGLIKSQVSDGRIQSRRITQRFHFPNNTVHGILHTPADHSFWLSTNGGLINYDYTREDAWLYDRSNGMNVTEFSDGAYFIDPQSNDLFFGGTNGFVIIHKEDIKTPIESFPIIFKNIRVNEENYNLMNFMKDGVLMLNYTQNFFTLSFSVADHINRNKHTYFYKLEGLNSSWFNNYNSNKIVVTNLPPGTYELLVKYQYGQMESEVTTLKIRILAPWYASWWAYLIYFILAVLVGWYIYYLISLKKRRARNKQMAALQQRQKEEIYESKLRFFTNITHELCTPLTLIAGPCQRILEYKNSDDFVLKYARLIERNAHRMNELTQELIEFRRIETQHKQFHIENIEITRLTEEIFNSFSDLAESKGITYQMYVAEHVCWNTDANAIITILTNLISNAFKYTSHQGDIAVKVDIEGDRLVMKVSNSGEGIPADKIDVIFDRYRILDNFEKKSRQGEATQNGLGLAICKSLVGLLHGEISVKSTPQVSTVFTVELPPMPLSETEGAAPVRTTPILNKQINEFAFPQKQYEFIDSRQTIFVIDNDPEMLWFVSELFADQYNVFPLSGALQALKKLEMLYPDIIISDICLPDMDGIEFTKHIKEDIKTAHIPIVLLSASQDVNQKIKSMESGADIYLNKPFDVEYLRTVVSNLIRRTHSLKDYYESPISNFNMANGKLLHSSDSDFLNKMFKIIDENIANPKLTTQFVAEAMGLSVRNLYKKLEGVTDITPSSIIKEYRLAKAQKLLIKTRLSIEEIIYKSGFSNRGTFYKLFSAKYGCTPKLYREKMIKEAIDPEEEEGEIGNR